MSQLIPIIAFLAVGSVLAPSELLAVPVPSLPVSFAPNHGQWEDGVRFRARHGELDLVIEEGAIALGSVVGDQGVVVRLRFRGAGASAVSGAGRQTGIHNYLRGPDPERWVHSVPLYDEVRFSALYPGIGLRVYDGGPGFEYDFLVEPGADLQTIRVDVEGADAIRVEANGAMVLETGIGDLRQPAPRTWYETQDGQQVPVMCSYVVFDDGSFGFEVAGPREDLALVIDPVLLWSSFFGGSGSETSPEIDVDAAGIVTLMGQTSSSDFPVTAGAFDLVFNGGGPFNSDTVVARFDPAIAGSGSLLWATFLGGSGTEAPAALFVDNATGQVTVAGWTNAPDFPTSAGSYSPTPVGGEDAFVATLSADGTSLVYGTYLGSTAIDQAYGVRKATDGRIIVSGSTQGGFPATPGAFDTTFNGGRDNFVAVLDPGQTGAAQLVYSTFLGSPGHDDNVGCDIDGAGTVVVVTSVSQSVGFPTTAGCLSPASAGSDDTTVSLLAPNGNGTADLLYSTYLGGSSRDLASVGYLEQATGNIVVAGQTQSGNFPTTAGAYDTSYAGGNDMFICRIQPGGAGAADLLYSTFIGGSAQDSAADLHLKPSEPGQCIWAGLTASANFPSTPGALQAAYAGGIQDGVYGTLNMSGLGAADLVYSSFLGSSGRDYCTSVQLSAGGVLTLAGVTDSGAFPTTGNAYDPSINGSSDFFIAQLGEVPVPAVVMSLEAVQRGAAVELRWDLAGVDELDAILVQRRDGAAAFRTRAVLAQGDATARGTWTDSSPSRDDAVYRVVGRVGEIEIESNEARLEETSIPARDLLVASVPNPFNPRTEIRFQMAASGSAELAIYDPAGRRVRTESWSALAAGPHSFVWDGTDRRGQGLASGVYRIRLTTAAGTDVMGVALVR